ncbi:MAG: 4Fe-4S binding protein [Clostridia bacterium]|nr:4Fe-4S binding protein [Clostridia bacterium]
MNAVVFYSNTGQSEAVAKYLGEALGYTVVDIEGADSGGYEDLVLVFPVHAQNIPRPVRELLKKTRVKNLTAIATYGKMCYGNVLYEIQNEFHMNIVAGAYIPAKHAYIDGDGGLPDLSLLTPIIEKIKAPSEIELPKLYKNPLADLFPKTRSRLGVKLYKNSNCNGCGACAERCHFRAIDSGVTNGRCIRCLRCVKVCPNNALEFKARLPMRLYLSKKKVNETVIYV